MGTLRARREHWLGSPSLSMTVAERLQMEGLSPPSLVTAAARQPLPGLKPGSSQP